MPAAKPADEAPVDAPTVQYLVVYATGISVSEVDGGPGVLFKQGEALSDGAAALHSEMLLRAGMVAVVPKV